MTLFDKAFLFMKKNQGQGQRSRSQWTAKYLNPKHLNQFFSKNKNIVFFKLGEKLLQRGVHNRLDFGENRSRHKKSAPRPYFTLKNDLDTTSR